MHNNRTEAVTIPQLKLRISIGDKNLGKAKNKTATWAQLISKMSEPMVDIRHTLPQYLNLSKERQAELKNQGWFVGGHCDEGIRQIGKIKERWVVTLDVDECSQAHVFDMECGLMELSKYEFFAYSTRKHTPEKPRLRVIIPLDSPCEAEAYHALSRILAEKFDVSMESIDPVSYRVTQLMYWPSVCKDADFYVFHNSGEVCSPEDVLNEFGDWQDHTKLPRSERDTSGHAAAGKKPEDPETKEGLVGAFCRSYDVTAAINEFLSEIYIDPVETHHGIRYTYAGGTTSHGAIVYDDGKFLYSNHMHDPAAGHSQNSFDLVRIHLFNDLDKKVKEGTSPMSMPSVKAMLDFLADDKEIAKELRASKYDLESMFREPVDDDDVFQDLGQGDDSEEDDDDLTDWTDELDANAEGVIKPVMNNVVLILMNDPRFKKCVRRNLFSNRQVYMDELNLKPFKCDPLPNTDRVNGSLWTDTHTLYVKMMLESPRGKQKPGYGLQLSKENLNSAIELAGARQAFHPVKDYLHSLKWDGKKRAEKLFITYLGAADNEYHREVCRLTLLAAVTRIFEPGHKFDFMPVLEGMQGKRKSTFVKVLAKNWFSEMDHVDDKNKAIETMSGSWILEFNEMQQFSRADVNRVKAFLSATDETTRLAYERNPRKFLRQCIFIGTTNQKEYLKDETGNRRFWPVLCEILRIDIDKLKRNVDQIWAEVATWYFELREAQPFGDLPLYLKDESLIDFATALQASRKPETPEEILAGQIEHWLSQPITLNELKGTLASEEDPFSEDKSRCAERVRTCSAEIYEKVLGNDRKRLSSDKTAQFQIGKAMQFVQGWARMSKPSYYGSYGKQAVMYERTKTQSEDDEL